MFIHAIPIVRFLPAFHASSSDPPDTCVVHLRDWRGDVRITFQYQYQCQFQF